MLLRLLCVVLFLIDLNRMCVCQEEKSISTSIATMMKLLDIEKVFIEISNDFVNELEMKLKVIEDAILQMTFELERAKLDLEAYVSNPVKAFSLVRRMQADWVQWEIFLKQAVGHALIQKMRSYRKELPTETDLKEAVTGIHRLQITYDMEPKNMATGFLNGKQYDAQLTAQDLAAIGNILYQQKYYAESSIWLKLAIDAFDENDINVIYNFNKIPIYELYANTLLIQAFYDDAITVLSNALKYEPENTKLHKKKRLLEYQVTTTPELMPPQAFPMKEPVTYAKGCRGELQSRPNALHCRFKDTTNDFLKLAPLKMEEISLDPYMVLFHDIISEREIEHLKALTAPNLRRAAVWNQSLNKYVAVEERTTQAVGLDENWTNTTFCVHERIGDMTGFVLTNSDTLQVINYGLGGHYDQHLDYFTFSEHTKRPSTGNRLATVIIYLSDVEQGGATIFPKINIAIPPQKGTALVWYNLNSRGEGDPRTAHAACPVLVGSKWIVTKWIREAYQFRIRPCPRD